jgi:CotH kinase protein
VTDCQYTGAFNDVEFPGTLVFDGVVYDHIQFKNRGIGSTYVSGKNKWAFLFNRARDFEPRDNWGNKYSATWNSFGMDANASPWAAVHRGSAGVEEALSYRIFELAGVPSLRTHYVHFRVIDDAAETGATQFDGDLWGLYLALEPMEANFLDERNLPDGNIYSIEGNNGDKKHQSPTQPTGQSDWTAFRDAVALGGQSEAFYRANEDLANLYTFLGVSRLVGNVDVRPGDNYRYYHRPTDNRWLVMPYDLDMQFIAAHHWGGGMDGGTVVAGAPNTIRAISRYPATIGVEFRNRCRELLSLMASDASPSGGQIGQLVDEYAQLVNPAGVALTWADLDAAMWNLHPRTAGGGANTGQSSHKGNFWRATYNDGPRGGLGGTVQTASWIRQLADPDANQFSDHEGLMQWFVNYSTNTWPGGTWLRKAVTTGAGADPSTDRQKGYGYKYLEWESLYGGWVSATAEPTAAADLSFPNTPAITYAGPAGFPANALDFTSSAFSPSASGGTTFSAMQWRIGEISAPGIPGYIAGTKRTYEIEHVWTSAEIAPFTATARIPLAYAEPGKTYRARVRHKDANGRWSRWSAPVQFIPGTPDVSTYTSSLVISELNYNPAPVTPAEFSAGFSSDDFEWVEVKNVSALAADMTGLRFTKGVDFDFPSAWTIPPGGFALVVRNLAAFRMRYGNSLDGIIAGATPDNFNNAGEQVKLSYGVGTPVVDFIYSDLAPWPTAADGSGKTLSLRSASTLPDPTLAANWKASYATGGSPGADDLLTFDAWNDDHPGVTDLLGDNDGDGILNLLEYGLAANPLANDPTPLPVRAVQSYTVTGVPGDYLTLTFTRRTDASDLTFFAEFTTELTSPWSPGVLAGSVAGPGETVIETWRSPAPLGAEPRQFGRLRVVAP